MYKWDILVILKNREKILGLYMGPENNTNDVANNLLGKCNSERYFFGFMDITMSHNVLVNIDEVAAIDISQHVDRD